MTKTARSQRPDHPASATFTPAWWLPGAHPQTLWPFLFHRKPPAAPRWERLELADGDFLDLAWFGDSTQDRPLCLLLHGLEGSYESHYLPGLIDGLDRAGWRPLVMHFRGCSGDPNRLPRSYHSGETGDLEHVVQLLRRRERPMALAAVGFSLGGNVLLKYLGERGDAGGIDAACAISVPFDLAAGAARLNRGFSRLYQWWLVRALRRKIRAKFAYMESPIDLEALMQQRSFRQFDGYVTAPLHGFRDADDYYQRSSSKPYLKWITTPTLLLQAADDPFLEACGRPDPAELPPCVQLELSRHGGHVGFVNGRWPWCANYWLEHRIPAFLQAFHAVENGLPKRLR